MSTDFTQNYPVITTKVIKEKLYEFIKKYEWAFPKDKFFMEGLHLENEKVFRHENLYTIINAIQYDTLWVLFKLTYPKNPDVQYNYYDIARQLIILMTTTREVESVNCIMTELCESEIKDVTWYNYRMGFITKLMIEFPEKVELLDENPYNLIQKVYEELVVKEPYLEKEIDSICKEELHDAFNYRILER